MNKVTALLAVKANTRVALATALVERNAECEALRMKLNVLTQERDMFAATAHNAIARNDGLDPVTGVPAPRVQTQRALPAHFIAAREAAMRMGKAVRVQA